MVLMLPLLPVNTILDGLHNIEMQAEELSLTKLTQHIFEYIKIVWIENVTPDLFCVHRLANRINENVISPFKKLRDYLTISKGKCDGNALTVFQVIEKLTELDLFLEQIYLLPNKKFSVHDLSLQQRKNVLAAWQYIENHPKIDINIFFSKVTGYIKCMEKQLWIWGFYRHTDDLDDELIHASNFQIVAEELIGEPLPVQKTAQFVEDVIIEELHDEKFVHNKKKTDGTEVIEALINDNDNVVLKESQEENFINFLYNVT